MKRKENTYFFLLPEVDSDAIYRHHDVDFLLLDVLHLELVLRNRKDDQINTLRFSSNSGSEGVDHRPCRQFVPTKSFDFYRKMNTLAASEVSD